MRTLATSLALLSALLLVGCGHATPTAPSTTTAAALQMRWDTDTICGDPQHVCMQGTNDTPNQIGIVVAGRFPASCPAHTIRGTVKFDPNVIRFARFAQDTFLKQDGVTLTQSVSETTNTVTFSLARPLSASNVAGQGPFLRLYFTLAPPAVAGSVGVVEWSFLDVIDNGGTSCVLSKSAGQVLVS